MTATRTAAALVTALLALAAVLLDAGAAQACSCAEPGSIGEQISAAPIAFTATQVDRIEGATGVTLVMEVEQAYLGEVGDIVELSTGFGDADCGVDLTGAGQVGILPSVFPGDLSVSICGGVVDATALRYHFEPLPEPPGTGPPAFVAGMSLAGRRLALLDAGGRVLRYGAGEGRTVAFAACPGHRLGVEVVEMPESVGGPDVLWTVGGGLDPTLAVRDLETMEILSEERIEMTERATTWAYDQRWVTGLQCHDEDASTVTFLTTSGVWDEAAAWDLAGPAELHVWRGGIDTVHDVGVARTAQASAERGVAWLVTGTDGRGLVTVDLATGAVVDEEPLPGDQGGWMASWDPRRETLAILGHDGSRDDPFGAAVDTVTVYDMEVGEATSHPLPEAGFAAGIDHVGDRLVATIRIEDFDVEPAYFAVISFAVDGDEVTEVGRVERAAPVIAAAARPGAAIAATWEAAPDVTLGGATAPIDGVYDVSLLAVFGNDEVEPPAAEVPPTTTGTPPSSTEGPAAATLPPGGDGGSGGGIPDFLWPLLAGVAAVGAGALLLRRQRKPPL